VEDWVAVASVFVVIARGDGETVIDTVAELVLSGLEESASDAVKWKVPLAEGVPDMTPVAELRLRPDGRLPDEIDHTYGLLPPTAESEAL
jgi:hypothetical protein